MKLHKIASSHMLKNSEFPQSGFFAILGMPNRHQTLEPITDASITFEIPEC